MCLFIYLFFALFINFNTTININSNTTPFIDYVNNVVVKSSIYYASIMCIAERDHRSRTNSCIYIWLLYLYMLKITLKCACCFVYIFTFWIQKINMIGFVFCNSAYCCTNFVQYFSCFHLWNQNPIRLKNVSNLIATQCTYSPLLKKTTVNVKVRGFLSQLPSN